MDRGGEEEQGTTSALPCSSLNGSHLVRGYRAVSKHLLCELMAAS